MSGPPAELYHYTSPTGVLGIIGKKAVWATVIYFLNDSKEFGHSIELAGIALRRIRNDQNDVDHVKTCDTLVERLNGRGIAPNLCVFSLSEESDLLSQWRAYCPPDSGYSIGFNTADLVNTANGQDFRLVQCVYDQGQQRSLLDPIIQKCVTVAKQRRVAGQSLDQGVEFALREIYREFADLAVRFKHPSFSEEKEWRLVSGIKNFDDPQMEHRSGRTMVIPYFTLKLDPLPVVNITVGPTSHMDAARDACASFLSKSKVRAAVGPSKIPYRLI